MKSTEVEEQLAVMDKDEAMKFLLDLVSVIIEEPESKKIMEDVWEKEKQLIHDGKTRL